MNPLGAYCRRLAQPLIVSALFLAIPAVRASTQQPTGRIEGDVTDSR